jgi:F-type H+-transporting ATPase subunit a
MTEEASSTKSKVIRILLIIGGIYLAGIVLLIAIFGFSRSDHPTFAPAEEFRVEPWIELPGPLDISRPVFYLFLAMGLTVATMIWIARKMSATKPNLVQVAIEQIYKLMRDNITRGNVDEKTAQKWFPFIGTLFLFIWFNNLLGYLPLPVNDHATVNIAGAEIPSIMIYAATANIAIPLTLALMVFVAYNVEGIRAKGPIGYLKGLVPAGVTGGMAVFIFILEFISNFMRLISLSVRLFANLLAGHLIILFMAGGLAVLLGLEVLGWLTLPFGVALFLFEVGLIATLQAFIFATLTAIYLGGAVAEHH